jgi:hypothetical protein
MKVELSMQVLNNIFLMSTKKKEVKKVLFLKQNSISYKPKNTKIFEKKHIDKFLLTIFDEKFLMKKIN